jgi:uncharacterized membrane protein YebE (DUF533 family)
MFDAKKLLDTLVAAAGQMGQQGGQATPQAPSRSPLSGQGAQGTGSMADQLVQKAKDVMAQNPGLAPAVMIGLAGLFSSKKRSGKLPGGGLAKLGGLALIGTLAYKAFQNHQAGKPILGGIAGGEAMSGSGQGSPATGLASVEPPRNSLFDPISQTEDDALLYLRAMVAAASADGTIDESERQRITKGLAEAGIDPSATRWLENEMANPADVDELSDPVTTPEKAAQVYAAARLAIEPDTMQEREFLRQLAKALDLDDGIRAQIEATVGEADGAR